MVNLEKWGLLPVIGLNTQYASTFGTSKEHDARMRPSSPISVYPGAPLPWVHILYDLPSGYVKIAIENGHL